MTATPLLKRDPQALLDARMSRRAFIAKGLGGAALLMAAPHFISTAQAALLHSPARRIALNNLHTGETCALTYWEDGDYLPEAMATINRVLRDHRTNETHPIDPALMDLLAALHQRLETRQPFEVISGYRSPASNAAMHAQSSGVAGKSLHMEGKAMDLRVADRALTAVHATSVAMGLGGVGYYPSSDFVHVDTGRVRRWSGA
ncbi:MAG: DUF882 domain-containing protein [Pseudomonadota bacterium]